MAKIAPTIWEPVNKPRENDPVVKRGLLLTYVGEATNDIFDTLSNTGTDYDSAVQSLTQRFDPARNKDMEIYEFCQITEASGETLNEFYRRLKEKASTCEFASEESEIRTQIIHKTSDTRLRRRVTPQTHSNFNFNHLNIQVISCALNISASFDSVRAYLLCFACTNHASKSCVQDNVKCHKVSKR